MSETNAKPSYTRYPNPYYPLASKIYRSSNYPSGTRFDVRATYDAQHTFPQELLRQVSSLQKERIQTREKERVDAEQSWKKGQAIAEPRIEDLFLKAKLDENETELRKIKEKVEQGNKKITSRGKNLKRIKNESGAITKTVREAKNLDRKKERLIATINSLVKTVREAGVLAGVLSEGDVDEVDWVGVLLGITRESDGGNDEEKEEKTEGVPQKQQQAAQMHETGKTLPRNGRFDIHLITLLKQLSFPALALFLASRVPAAQVSMLSSTRNFLFKDPSPSPIATVTTTSLSISDQSLSIYSQYPASSVGSLTCLIYSLASFFFSLLPLRNFGPVQPSSWTSVLDILTFFLLLTPWFLSRTRVQKMNSTEQIVYVGLGLAAALSTSSSSSSSPLGFRNLCDPKEQLPMLVCNTANSIKCLFLNLPLLFFWMKLSESRSLWTSLCKTTDLLLRLVARNFLEAAWKTISLLLLNVSFLAILLGLIIGATKVGIWCVRRVYVWAQLWYFIRFQEILWRLRSMIWRIWPWLVAGVCVGLHICQCWLGDEDEAVSLLARLVSWIEILSVWLWSLHLAL